MKIRQLRNATIVLETGDYKILVDPMLASKGEIPPLKYFVRQRNRNPLVALPEDTLSYLEDVTHVLITHCQKGHFDHLDRAAIKWIRRNKIPVICMDEDLYYLQKMGLQCEPLQPDVENLLLGARIFPIPCLHGDGVVGKMMAHGHGYILQFPNEPSVYIAGDTILTEEVRAALRTFNPEIMVAPAGGAKFDIGERIIMGLEDVLPLAQVSRGKIVLNHLEALDHCPVKRNELVALRDKHGLQERLFIPDDGETLVF